MECSSVCRLSEITAIFLTLLQGHVIMSCYILTVLKLHGLSFSFVITILVWHGIVFYRAFLLATDIDHLC